MDNNFKSQFMNYFEWRYFLVNSAEVNTGWGFVFLITEYMSSDLEHVTNRLFGKGLEKHVVPSLSLVL